MEIVNVGKVGTRIIVSGVVEKVTHIPTEWGASTELVILCAQNVRVQWRAAHRLELVKTDSVSVRATIKAYRWSAGGTVVEVTRGTVLEDALALF